MKTSEIIWFCIYVFVGCPLLLAQTPADGGELEQLKSAVISQQNLLEQQQAQIQALQLALAEQKQMLVGIVQERTQGAKLARAVTEPSADYHTAVTHKQASDSQVAPIDQEPLSAEQEKVGEDL